MVSSVSRDSNSPLSISNGQKAAEADLAAKEPSHLPTEIILEILSYLPVTRPSSQAVLYHVCLVSSEWYHAAVRRLYYQPYIIGKNFDLFVRTICPSINAHIKRSDLALLVNVLDLSRLIHHSTKSTTARLLGRVKPNLTWFRAPASSFGLNCFAALSKCVKLQRLDLSLVNDAISMYSLSHSLKKLPHLTKLALPRSGLRVEDFDPSNLTLPPKLTEITLQGGLTDSFLRRLVRPFQALSCSHLDLSIVHCPHITSFGIYDFLTPIADSLRYLRIANIPLLGTHRSEPFLDKILTFCPLEELSISSDYVTWLLIFPKDVDFWEESFSANPAFYYQAMVKESMKRKEDRMLAHPFPLRTFELTSSGSPNMDYSLMLRPKVLTDAILHGRLPNLRRVDVASSCGWTRTNLLHETRELIDLLHRKATEDSDKSVADMDQFDYGFYSFDDGD